MRLHLMLAAVLVTAPLTAAKKPKSDPVVPTAPAAPTDSKGKSTPLAPVPTPSTPTTSGTNRWTRQLDLKLLVLAGSGTEPSFAAIRFFLDHMGVPYDSVVIGKQPLPALGDATRGFYQGIILATGNLYHVNGSGQSAALPVESWMALDLSLIHI